MDSNSNPPTLVASKTRFLTTQIRLLSSPLTPSTHTISRITNTYDDAPNPKTISDVIDKVNAKIKTHNDRVYTTETTRHVAGQIDALYWEEVKSRPRPGEGDETIVERRKDLTESEYVCSRLSILPFPFRTSGIEGEPGHIAVCLCCAVRLVYPWLLTLCSHDRAIASLPRKFEDTFLRPASPPLASDDSQYTSLLSRLHSLSSSLKTSKQQLAQYQHLLSLLEPLRNPREDVQPNLASKGGELERELERMRVLAGRVKAGVEKRGWEGEGGDNGEMEVDARGEERERLVRVLDGL